MSRLTGLGLSLQRALGRMILPRKKVRAGNIQFTLSCNNAITHYRWKHCLTKEALTLDWIDNQILGDGVFFDIGANIGEFSIYAALKHPRMRVLAFEPEYSNLSLLKENIVANGLQQRIEPFGFALGHTTGLSYLHLQDLTPGSAKHTASRNFLEQTAEKCPVIWREGICTYTLDQFCAETKGLKNIEIGGIMMIAPFFESQELVRPYFKKARRIFERMFLEKSSPFKGSPNPALSMGMSGDFETAIEEGSTMIRLGTAIFGSRKVIT